jgi:DNA-binding MarR family transcriptional regulator
MSGPPDPPPTLQALPSYLAGRVWKGARAGIQAALAGHGLGTADHGVLTALDDLGPLSQQEIADRLDADKSHVMRLIDQLEQRGLVARTPDPADRRRHRVELSSAGRRLVRAATPDARQAEDNYFRALSPAERRTLTDLLRTVLDSHERR